MGKGTIRVLHPDLDNLKISTTKVYWSGETEIRNEIISLTPKIRAEREKVLLNVMKKLNKKNINIVSTDVTETHTIINYEVK